MTDKNNSIKRSHARGVGERGNTHVPDSGRDAYNKSKKSENGVYRVEFTNMFGRVTERDIELRKVYGKDLVADNVGVPSDMITLRVKNTEQTLTASDEVFYVKVGTDNYGKLSIRTQRGLRGSTLIFVFQVKKNAPKPPKKSYSQTMSKPTASQKAQSSRNSWNRRKK